MCVLELNKVITNSVHIHCRFSILDEDPISSSSLQALTPKNSSTCSQISFLRFLRPTACFFPISDAPTGVETTKRISLSCRPIPNLETTHQAGLTNTPNNLPLHLIHDVVAGEHGGTTTQAFPRCT